MATMSNSITEAELQENIGKFVNFMVKRHNIYTRRSNGAQPPWTNDVILRTYRFCNIFRELDTVTIWIRKNIREPYADHRYLWFFLCLARQINLPSTIGGLIDSGVLPTDSDDFQYKKMMDLMHGWMSDGRKIYTSAYMLPGSIDRNSPDFIPTKPYTTARILNLMWRDRESLTEFFDQNNTIEAVTRHILRYKGFGGFLSYEVATDMRHTRYLRNATDIYTWANAGPGAKRGLNRIFGRNTSDGLSSKKSLEEMRVVFEASSRLWVSKNNPPLEMRDIEHSLCEFDKYSRVSSNEGRPRQK